MLSEQLTLWGLFISSLLSSTLLPGNSEIVLAALLINQSSSPIVLLGIASLGNTIGGMISYGIGRAIACKYSLDKPQQPKQQKAITHLQKWGNPLLIFSWVPIIGDPLCFAAGWVKSSWLGALFFIAAGKTARYAVIASSLS